MVASIKPVLPVHTWSAALVPNPAASVFIALALNGVRRANLQDYQNQEEFILTNSGGNHKYCVWLTATVQMDLVRAIQILVKERDIVHAGAICWNWQAWILRW